MAWMLQPKNYIEIARPNLYNVAYRRVGAYKGMGRLNPTNYLQIGTSPNRIGGTTGQYSTLSGQLSIAPPSLRGLGADRTTLAYPGMFMNEEGIIDLSKSPYATGGDWSPSDTVPYPYPGVYSLPQRRLYANPRFSPAPGEEILFPQLFPKKPLNLGLLAAIGVGLVVVLAARRR